MTTEAINSRNVSVCVLHRSVTAMCVQYIEIYSKKTPQ